METNDITLDAMMPSADLPSPQLDLCDICGATTFEPWLEVTLGGIYDRWIHRCRSCGFRQVRPRLTPVELERLYPADYFDSTGSVGYGDYPREAQRRTRDAYFVARRLRRRVSSACVLEVGCALGFLLAALRDEGLDVQGVDASAFAAYFARTRFGLSVLRGTLEDARFPAESFDLVIQKDLLEHVLNPRQHLLDTARVMRRGAELLLITPNGEANLRPLAALGRATASTGDELPLLDQGHLSFFSRTHLHRLFEDSGFVIEQARAIGVRRGLRALGLLPGQRRFARSAPRAQHAIGPEAKGSEPVDDERFRQRADWIDAEIARYHSWVRAWVPYYYVRRFLQRLDTLPDASGVGYDFEFRLRKR